MPSKTFENLSDKKKEKIIDVSLKEFSENNFEAASLNKIIKELSISRGSLYQYFENKIDLWLFLKDYSERKKMGYVNAVDRSNYNSFWVYLKELYIKGAEFDFAYPNCSKFLYKISLQESSKEVEEYIIEWKSINDQGFLEWVKLEQSRGSFNANVSTEAIAHFIQTIGNSLLDLLHNNYSVDFDKALKTNKGLLTGNMNNYINAVDEIISLLSKALK